MTARALRNWYLVHKWTSLISTVFLLMLCLTGLPLIFHEEIEHYFEPHPELKELTADAPRIDQAGERPHQPDHVSNETGVAGNVPMGCRQG